MSGGADQEEILNMSEEAKEKPGAGKAAHRKKKGKKVRERAASLSGCVCFCSANMSVELLDGGDINEEKEDPSSTV